MKKKVEIDEDEFFLDEYQIRDILEAFEFKRMLEFTDTDNNTDVYFNINNIKKICVYNSEK